MAPARPASPPSKLPVPNAPTTQGIDEAALVGGGAIAETANKLGDEVAAGQDLGEHDPKGVLEQDEHAKPEREGAKQIASSGDANTAARFMDPNVPTPVSSSDPPMRVIGTDAQMNTRIHRNLPRIPEYQGLCSQRWQTREKRRVKVGANRASFRSYPS